MDWNNQLQLLCCGQNACLEDFVHFLGALPLTPCLASVAPLSVACAVLCAYKEATSQTPSPKQYKRNFQISYHTQMLLCIRWTRRKALYRYSPTFYILLIFVVLSDQQLSLDIVSSTELFVRHVGTATSFLAPLRSFPK